MGLDNLLAGSFGGAAVFATIMTIEDAIDYSNKKIFAMSNFLSGMNPDSMKMIYPIAEDFAKSLVSGDYNRIFVEAIVAGVCTAVSIYNLKNNG